MVRNKKISQATSLPKKALMLKISILYPNTKGSRFDFSYYVDTHMPMSIKLLSTHPGFKGVSVERGLSGGIPGTNAAYIAMCHFLFDSVEDFMAAFISNSAILQGDMPNYTDIEPVIQVNEVLISQ
jgi:uncharacterized protein (TIGR02118 family)